MSSRSWRDVVAGGVEDIYINRILGWQWGGIGNGQFSDEKKWVWGHCGTSCVVIQQGYVSVNISFTAYKIKIIILAACICTFGLIRPHLVHHAVPLSNISANTTDYLITFLYFMVHRGFTSTSFCSCS